MDSQLYSCYVHVLNPISCTFNLVKCEKRNCNNMWFFFMYLCQSIWEVYLVHFVISSFIKHMNISLMPKKIPVPFSEIRTIMDHLWPLVFFACWVCAHPSLSYYERGAFELFRETTVHTPWKYDTMWKLFVSEAKKRKKRKKMFYS